jgi:hypothetical protein
MFMLCCSTLNVNLAQRFAIQTPRPCCAVRHSMSLFFNTLQCKVYVLYFRNTFNVNPVHNHLQHNLLVHVLLSGTQCQPCSTIYDAKVYVHALLSRAQCDSCATICNAKSMFMHCCSTYSMSILINDLQYKLLVHVLLSDTHVNIVQQNGMQSLCSCVVVSHSQCQVCSTIYNTNSSSMVCCQTLNVNLVQRFAMQCLCPYVVAIHSMSGLLNVFR